VRALFLSHVIPYPPTSGTTQRVFHLLKALAGVAEVTLVCPAASSGRDPELGTAQRFCYAVHCIPPRSNVRSRDESLPRVHSWVKGKLRYLHPSEPVWLQLEHSEEGRALVARLCQKSFDVVWVERLTSLRLLPTHVGSRVVIDLDDLEHRKAARRLSIEPFSRMWPLEVLDLIRMRALERGLLRLPYEFAVCSATDRRILGMDPRVHILPNGTDVPTDERDTHGPPVSPDFAFVGHMGYQPNVDAVCFFHDQILPLIRHALPDARFFIVGHDPHARVRQLHDGMRVIVTGSVPDVTPYLRSCAIAVAPLRFGAGTRIKILEALAHRIPVVCTTMAAEGLDVENGRQLLLADTPHDFAHACLRVWRDPGLRARLSEEGVSLVRRRYDWAQIEEQMKALVVQDQPTQANLGSER